MNLFPTIYYAAALLACVGVLVAIFVKDGTYKYAAAAALTLPLTVAYLLGMYRIQGVDFLNYQGYLLHRDLIPDVGYRVLMEVATFARLELGEFFLIQGLFTLIATYALANKLRSDIVVVITLYMLHAAIVRDFSQSRAGLALAIYFLALAQGSRTRYGVLTIIAASVHLTIVPLIAVYHWAEFLLRCTKWRTAFALAPAVVLISAVPLLLKVMAMVDPRVEIYMNWQKDMYGSPTESYAAMLLLVLIGAICFQVQRATHDRALLVLLIMIGYSALIFFGFRDLSIFASRLSNVTAALYPFAIGRAIFLMKSDLPSRPRTVESLALTFGMLMAILLALIARSGSLEVLKATEPALLAY